MSNKKEKWNPFEGELMSIQDTVDGYYYVEIPDLNWSSRYPWHDRAFDAALEQIAVHKDSDELDDLVLERRRLQKCIAARNEHIEKLRYQIAVQEKVNFDDQEQINEITEQIENINSTEVDLSDEREIAEQASGIRRVLAKFFDDSDKHRRIGINIYRDYDGDGDLDVSFSVTGSKKRFVT
jgi:hypothetical protein